jgi:phage shock protein A
MTMSKLLIKIATVIAIPVVLLTLLAGKSLHDLSGYMRASAETTVDRLTDGLPRDVLDKKLQNDLASLRAELVDRRVTLNQSARQIEQIRADVQALSARVDRGRQILVEAYPVLQEAIAEGRATVRFGTTEMTRVAFEAEIDDLLAQRDCDTQELAAKRQSLAQLEKHQRQAEVVWADFRRALQATESEVALLKNRRATAEVQARIVDLLAPIEKLKAPHTSIESLGRLRDEVTQLEVWNDALRTIAPVGGRPAGDTLVRVHTRLEKLEKAVQGKAQSVKSANNTIPLQGGE